MIFFVSTHKIGTGMNHLINKIMKLFQFLFNIYLKFSPQNSFLSNKCVPVPVLFVQTIWVQYLSSIVTKPDHNDPDSNKFTKNLQSYCSCCLSIFFIKEQKSIFESKVFFQNALIFSCRPVIVALIFWVKEYKFQFRLS